MPDPGEDYQRWSTVADNNGDIDLLIDWKEGQARRSVNNSSRSEMAAHAKNRTLLNGSIVTTGLPNAQAFLSGVNYVTIPTGLLVKLKVGSGLDNDDIVTLSMDSVDPIVVKNPDLTDTKGGEFKSDRYVDLIYNGTNWIYLYSAGNFAPTEDPVFDGDPQAPTPPLDDDDNSIATTEWVRNLVEGGEGIIKGQQVFATPGIFEYIPSPRTKAVIIECIGAGGGGGGAWTASVVTSNYAGGGGGGGGYSRKHATGTEIGASISVTVGAGGVGGTASGPGAGGAGGATFVGDAGSELCKANGGGGAQPGWLNQMPQGGEGAQAGTGDLTVAGSPGENGTWDATPTIDIIMFNGNGADGPLGGGARCVLAADGATATGFGAGGAGGSAFDGNPNPNAGGDGSGGVVIITEFSGSGAPGPTGPAGPVGPQGPIGPAGPAGAGTGDVLHFGTPTTGQLAQWTDASHIQGIPVASLGFATLASPTFTGDVRAPTAAALDNDNTVATTAWVNTAVAAGIAAAAGASVFSTGDLKFTHKAVADTGWIMWVDGTIGDASSAASILAATTAQALFLLYYSYTDANCPLLTSGGSATTRAAQGTAAAAWAAHCRMTLPLGPGRAAAIAGTGAGLTARLAGDATGVESFNQTEAQMPSHRHGGVPSSAGIVSSASFVVGSGGGLEFTNPGAVTGFTGGGSPISLMQPSTFINVMIKL